MKFLDELISLIDTWIHPEADNNITLGNIIASWFNEAIDTDREIVEKAHDWILDYRESLIEDLQTESLKIKFTNNSGYFIELPKSRNLKVPDYFIQRQTLTQVVRYTTVKLQEFEENLSRANSSLFEKEYNCFIDIRNNILLQFDNLYKLSRNISSIDFLLNGAYISSQKWYSCPEMWNNFLLDIKWWKHPVISDSINDFISNDLEMNKNDFVHVISWPNMWWKSTFLRQNALLILMAHIWYDIPASSSRIPLVDSIFSRVWSGDNLYLWQSTFMVEMQEISYILHNSSAKSFVIIDEIWRGTSTYDGMSLAWSILKYNHDKICAKTLFATHYHEISDYSQDLAWVSNYSVAVGENDENIVFLRKVIRGAMKKSYGIEVAKLAWIPREILLQAKKTMIDLQNKDQFQQLSFTAETNISHREEKDDFYKILQEEINSIELDKISPIDAMLKLKWLQEQVKK